MPVLRSSSNGNIIDDQVKVGAVNNGACASGSTSPSHGVSLKRTGSIQQSLFDKMEARIRSRDYWFSLEFFPPRTANGAANLCTKFERFARGGPLFCDITWHLAGDPSSDKPTSSLKIANVMLNYCGFETMLHVACFGRTADQLRDVISKAISVGIQNILPLRGDPPMGKKWVKDAGDFNYATEFVRFIRKEFGPELIIAVAGYPPPRGHPEASSYEDDLQHLKEKVDAGANFIITQLFFRVEDFLTFVTDCRRIGIKCPIIPGIFPIQAYNSLKQITALSSAAVPAEVSEAVEPIKQNDEAIRNFGIDFAVKMCREILASGQTFGLHFYTLNRDFATIAILKRLGLWQDESVQRPLLPWKHASAHPNRKHREDVRPIFWTNMPRSYVHRTFNWDEFPNGRWGDPDSAVFGDFDHHAFYIRHLDQTSDEGSGQRPLAMWGDGDSLKSEHEVWDIFVRFISGTERKPGCRVTRLPWSENEPLSRETELISTDLIALNSSGILTINSQPSVNGVDSGDPVLGWGAEHGMVYQKAYLEFFMPKQFVPDLIKVLAKHPLVNYHIVDAKSTIDICNQEVEQPIAVTWGVFPGKEIVQPTIVDPAAFRVWKDEAFAIWLNVWADLYPDESISSKVLHYIHGSYCLVSLVDNAFNRPTCLFRLCREMLAMGGNQYDPSKTAERIEKAIVESEQTIINGTHSTSTESNFSSKSETVV